MPNNDLSAIDRLSPCRHSALAALTLTSVMLVGAWQIIAAIQKPEGLDFPRTVLDFREGRTTGALEKQLDQNLPARTTLIALANAVRYTLTGGAGEQVRTGQDDWLFLTDELRFFPQGTDNLTMRADLLGAAGHALNQQGVKMVVVLVPDKARVHANKLASGRYPEYNRPRYQEALTALQVRNVTVVDLLKPLTLGVTQGAVYYRTDTHWNQAGAQVAAQALGQAVRMLGINLEKTTFSTTSSSEQIERPGDLLRLMGLDSAPAPLRPRADMEAPATTHQSSVDSPTKLFGDAGVPVALTGTSYSLRGNFHGFLQQTLSAKILNTAKDGGGFLTAATAYLLDDAFQSSKPKVLVWEVPERFLYTPLEGEDKWLEKVGLKH